jgi:hypothetical protein
MGALQFLGVKLKVVGTVKGVWYNADKSLTKTLDQTTCKKDLIIMRSVHISPNFT